jgi:hypothetical protein
LPNFGNPLQHRSAAHKSWFHTEDWSARTRPARDAFENGFLEQAGGDPKRAASLRRHYFAELARASAKARELRKQADGCPEPA